MPSLFSCDGFIPLNMIQITLHRQLKLFEGVNGFRTRSNSLSGRVLVIANDTSKISSLCEAAHSRFE